MITFGVAAYNIENYIASCLESIISQTNDNLEILVIDDGSTDSTGKICDEYAKKDSRVRVIHQENGGISFVRNRIIREAKGDWLCFVDGDDRVADGAYGNIISELNDELDVLCYERQSFVYDNSIPAFGNCEEGFDLSGDELRKLRLDVLYRVRDSKCYKSNAIRSICAKLFRVDFLRRNNLLLDERLAYSEDVVFIIDCFKLSSRIRLIRKPLQLYRMRGDSAVHKYNPNVVERLVPLAEAVVVRAGDDEALMERCYLDHIRNLRLVFRLDLCNRNNPKAYKQREAAFEALMLLPDNIKAIENVNPTLFTKNDKQWYDMLVKNDFAAICAMFKKRDAYEKAKLIANKTGLVKILKPIRNKLRREK